MNCPHLFSRKDRESSAAKRKKQRSKKKKAAQLFKRKNWIQKKSLLHKKSDFSNRDSGV